MNGKGLKFPSAAFIKLSKKLYILQTVSMDICAQGINCQVQAVSDYEYQYEYDCSRNGSAHHTSHLVKYCGYNAGSQTQGQKSGIGQDVAQV